jgi:3'-phosphoadenosine 5'-phosphosulfate sulfotransferase (PAPS reductase)/FAD synthetase
LTVQPDLSSYDRFVIAFSGGKDSLACALLLLRLLRSLGIPRDRIELWHHCIDGEEGGPGLFDWPVTPAYCAAVAEVLGLRLYYSWLEGGFEREMNRHDTPKAATVWQNPDGTVSRAGGAGPEGTRERFPQVAADLSVRWCSAYLKIDVMAAALRNSARFQGCRTLVITGERAMEDPKFARRAEEIGLEAAYTEAQTSKKKGGRSRYKAFEPHRTDNRDGRKRRHVDQWRPIHKWTTREVWQIIEEEKVAPHPCYEAGFGRCSCALCIFGSPDQWATAKEILPHRFARVASYEASYGCTIQRKESVVDRAARGTAYASPRWAVDACRSTEWTRPVIEDEWTEPLGAYADSTGPL